VNGVNALAERVRSHGGNSDLLLLMGVCHAPEKTLFYKFLEETVCGLGAPVIAATGGTPSHNMLLSFTPVQHGAMGLFHNCLVLI